MDDGGVFCTMIFCGPERMAILKCMHHFLWWIRHCENNDWESIRGVLTGRDDVRDVDGDSSDSGKCHSGRRQ